MKRITSVVNSPAKETWELEKEIEIMTLPLEATIMFMYAEKSKQIFLINFETLLQNKRAVKGKVLFKSIE